VLIIQANNKKTQHGNINAPNPDRSRQPDKVITRHIRKIHAAIDAPYKQNHTRFFINTQSNFSTESVFKIPVDLNRLKDASICQKVPSNKSSSTSCYPLTVHRKSIYWHLSGNTYGLNCAYPKYFFNTSRYFFSRGWLSSAQAHQSKCSHTCESTIWYVQKIQCYQYSYRIFISTTCHQTKDCLVPVKSCRKITNY